MKLALAALMMLTVLPAHAGGPRFRESIGDRSNRQAYESQSGYARQEKCYKRVYREEYVPGTLKNPGYVKSYKERIEVPCKKRVKIYQEHHHLMLVIHIRMKMATLVLKVLSWVPLEAQVLVQHCLVEMVAGGQSLWVLLEVV